MNAFTIKDLENLSGIKAHTIRVWEQRYSFLKPQRTTTNIRYYSNEELKALLNIALLNKYGYKISRIDQMEPAEIRQTILSLSDPAAVQERMVNELVQEMVNMQMDRFEQVIAGYIAAKGIEETVMHIIFPFLEKTGILWQTGHINPAQEHIVSNIIRHKLIVAIEAAAPARKKDITALLFLPEGEHHEMGLLFINYLLKSGGVQTIYLGANIPMKDAEYVTQIKNPDLVFVHLTATCPNFNFDKFLSCLGQKISKPDIYISGQLAQVYHKPVPHGIGLMRSLPDIVNLIISL